MAGIEKVCEYSGDYPGWLMYEYKRNHIQIMPQYRKDFRGKNAILYIQTSESMLGKYLIYNSRGGFSWHLNETEYKERIWKCGTKKYDLNEAYRGRSWYPIRVCIEYWYALVVPDMLGNVNGIYTNHTCDIPAVKRRMKRMLRCKKLEVRYINDLKELKEKY